MQITLEFLKKKNACIRGLNWHKNQKEKDVIKIIRELISDKDKIKSEYNGDYFLWANWLISRILSKIDCVQYAVFAAENVLHIFEKEYPLDGRPRNAIEAAKNYIKNPNKKNANADDAAYAADAAYVAAYAVAYVAANAANAVANAAYAAAYAADVAYAAAYADVADSVAAYAAVADAALKIKIINYGIELLKKY